MAFFAVLGLGLSWIESGASSKTSPDPTPTTPIKTGERMKVLTTATTRGRQQVECLVRPEVLQGFLPKSAFSVPAWVKPIECAREKL